MLAVQAALIAAPAVAQVRPPALSEAFVPDLAHRDLALLTRELDLDQGEQAIVQALLTDYQESFDAGVAQIRERLGVAGRFLLAEDPAIEQRREAIREDLAQAIEDMRAMGEKLPENATAEQIAEVRQKLVERVQALREELMSLQPEPVNADEARRLMTEAATHLEAWFEQRRQMLQQFYADIAAVLDERRLGDQLPGVQRALLRERAAPQGRLQGEAVDLLLISSQAGLDEAGRAVIEPLLREYEVGLDEALRHRQRATADSTVALMRAAVDDHEAIRAALLDEIEGHVRVRDVNDSFAECIIAALPDEQSVLFRDAWRSRGYARVFRPMQAQRAFEAAQAMALDDAARAAVAELRQRYDQEIDQHNQALLAVLREHEPQQQLTQAMARTQRDGNAAPEPGDNGPSRELSGPVQAGDPVQQAFAERQAIDERYAEALAKLLPQEPAGP